MATSEKDAYLIRCSYCVMLLCVCVCCCHPNPIHNVFTLYGIHSIHMTASTLHQYVVNMSEHMCTYTYMFNAQFLWGGRH